MVALYPSVRADTHTVPFEAEDGMIAGNATEVLDAGASGGQSVKFNSGTGANTCVAPSNPELLDQDFSDDQLPWERKGAPKVAINFETGNVTTEYLEYMQYAIQQWNRSACLDTKLVPSCIGVTNCVKVVLLASNEDEDDGNFDAEESGSFTVGGEIQLYTEPLDAQGPGAKKNVTVHEMGHAVGLRHRLTEHVLMNGDTYTDVFDPDETDMHNLLVLYGTQN